MSYPAHYGDVLPVNFRSYLYLFGLVEEYILPFLVDHTRTRIHKASTRKSGRSCISLRKSPSTSSYSSASGASFTRLRASL